jgi:hypothetical protein
MSDARRGMTLKQLHTRHRAISQQLSQLVYLESGVRNNRAVYNRYILDPAKFAILLAEEREIEQQGKKIVEGRIYAR